MALGSITWRWLAKLTSVSTALIVAALMGSFIGLIVSRWKLEDSENREISFIERAPESVIKKMTALSKAIIS